ncbi:unknown [Clostridium sp. CAG:590]|nr:unknown [Clostridium sp. CAG:590]
MKNNTKNIAKKLIGSFMAADLPYQSGIHTE